MTRCRRITSDIAEAMFTLYGRFVPLTIRFVPFLDYSNNGQFIRRTALFVL